MVYSRAYLASVVCTSGGAMTMGAPPDPTNHPALIGAHGAVGSDVFGNPIATNTILVEDDLKSKGSFVIDCDDGGDYLNSSPACIAGAWDPVGTSSRTTRTRSSRALQEPTGDLPELLQAH